MAHNLNIENNSEFPAIQQDTLPGHTRPRDFAITLKWIWFATLGMWLLGVYFLLVFFYAGTIFETPVQFRYLALTIIVSFGGLYGLVRWGYRQQWISVGRLKILTVASIAILMSLMVVDVGYSSYVNATTPPNLIDQADKEKDRQILEEEYFPKRYYPTARDFRIHKPNVTLEVQAYGGIYYSALQKSPTVVNTVLQLRNLTYSIDEYGFRETTPLTQAHIFALGDSYTFGVDTDQDKIWVEQLEQKLGEPTYNFGVSSSSPPQQRLLVEYMLQTYPDAMKMRHLVWMIFEGNALGGELLTPQSNQTQQDDSIKNLFTGTTVQTLDSIPFMIKNQSVINRWLTSNNTVDSVETVENNEAYFVDRMELLYPLYHSSKYGNRMFDPAYIELATRSESAVLNHPSLPMLGQTFKEMASLSQRYDFKVTIVIAPTPPRLYASYFEDFPPISKEPYLINYVEQLSTDQGFDVINLYPLLQPYASEELLFWRDDSHFDNRGNEIVAELIATQLPKRVVLDTSAD